MVIAARNPCYSICKYSNSSRGTWPPALGVARAVEAALPVSVIHYSIGVSMADVSPRSFNVRVYSIVGCSARACSRATSPAQAPQPHLETMVLPRCRDLGCGLSNDPFLSRRPQIAFPVHVLQFAALVPAGVLRTLAEPHCNPSQSGITG